MLCLAQNVEEQWFLTQCSTVTWYMGAERGCAHVLALAAAGFGVRGLSSPTGKGICGDSAAGFQSGVKLIYQHVNVVGDRHGAGEFFFVWVKKFCAMVRDVSLLTALSLSEMFVLGPKSSLE